MLSIVLFCFTLLISLTRAAPVQLEAREDVTQLLYTLNLYSQYSKAAYCKNNNGNDASSTVTCSNNTCPWVEESQAIALKEFENTGTSDGTGFVAVDHAHQRIVVSFRGSRSGVNVLNAGLGIFVPWNVKGCSYCFVHWGFSKSWQDLKPTVKQTIDFALKQLPNYRIVTTGHSLGGAIATLAAGELRAEGYAVDSISFGSPMVGNTAAATFITNQGNNYRVTNKADPAPLIFGYGIGWAHIGPEVWLTGSNYLPVQPQDVKIFQGISNRDGNWNAPRKTLTNDDHSFYFGYMAGCGGDGEIYKRGGEGAGLEVSASI